MSPFTNCSNSLHDIDLEDQADILKSFVITVNINRGNIERTVSAVVPNKRYHSPAADNISQKLWFSITAAKKTINNTNQNLIRPEVMPLMERYITDLMSHKLCRLRTIFYTDTLFPKFKSITGYDCAQIYTDVEWLFWIVPLFCNTEVGISLSSFAKQAGIPNQLHYDRAA